MDWIEKALGKKKRRIHKTEEERRAARLESQRRYNAKVRARKLAEKERNQCQG
jgi:hypothetical protein